MDINLNTSLENILYIQEMEEQEKKKKESENEE